MTVSPAAEWKQGAVDLQCPNTSAQGARTDYNSIAWPQQRHVSSAHILARQRHGPHTQGKASTRRAKLAHVGHSRHNQDTQRLGNNHACPGRVSMHGRQRLWLTSMLQSMCNWFTCVHHHPVLTTRGTAHLSVTSSRSIIRIVDTQMTALMHRQPTHVTVQSITADMCAFHMFHQTSAVTV